MSAVPAAIDGLVAVLSRTGVQVVDGPPTANVRNEVIAVGIGLQDSPDVNADLVDVGLASSRETFTVSCLARSWSGDNDIKSQRDRTYAVVDQARHAVTVDQTLSGAVSRARWAGSTYMPQRTDRGQLVVDVLFRVEVTQL